MQEFGRRHGLSYHGEIIPALPSASGGARYRILNAALIKGLHQFRRDDFDFWLTSSPYDETKVSLIALAPQALTQDELALADQLHVALRPMTCSDEDDARFKDHVSEALPPTPKDKQPK